MPDKRYCGQALEKRTLNCRPIRGLATKSGAFAALVKKAHQR